MKLSVTSKKIVTCVALTLIVLCLWISCVRTSGNVIEGFSDESGGGSGGKCSGGCSGGVSESSGDGAGLLPIMDAKFNLREICKNCLLLEDHLISPRKRCQDCIRKHFLIIEGLGDEARTLDKGGVYKQDLDKVSSVIYKLQKDYIGGRDMGLIGQDLRQVRKGLVPKCYDEIRKF